MRFPIFATALFAVCLSLSGCNKGKFQGTYASSVQSITFHGDKATLSLGGVAVGKDWPYTVYEKTVTFNSPGGPLVYTINDDGSLSDSSKDRLVKK